MEPIDASLGLDAAGIALLPGAELGLQLHEQLKARILQGQLPAALRLPTTRALAEALGISRNTVVRVYERLLSEGYLRTRTGDGTYVAALRAAAPAATAAAPEPMELPPPDTPMWARLQAFTPARRLVGPPRAFRHGVPALDLFPTETWSRLLARFWRRTDLQQLGYTEAAGLPRLRELIAAYLSHSRGLVCTAEQVVVTGGAQQAIALAALALLRPGDRVAIESPGYRAAAAALGLTGADLLRVPVDAEGLQLAALEAAGPCRLVHVTPSHQFPSCVAMSLPRRLELLAWARRHDAFVLEDDYDGEYRHTGLPLAPLASLDPGQRTLYVGSFSKLLAPGLRLGYLVAPAGWADTLARLRGLLDRHSPIAEQTVLADFIEQGHFLRHLRRARRAATQRRDALLEAWQGNFGSTLPLAPSDAGLHALLPLDEPAQEQRLVELGRAAGLELVGLREVGGLPPHSSRAGIVLGFGAVEPTALVDAVRTLSKAWRKG